MAKPARPLRARPDYLIDQAITAFAAASLLLGAGAFFEQTDRWALGFRGVVPEPELPAWFYNGWALGLLLLSACLGTAAFVGPVKRIVQRFRGLFQIWLPLLAWLGLLAGWLGTLSGLERGSLTYSAFLWVGFGWTIVLGVRLALSAVRSD
ncbi:MAG: hypothetical protein FJ314_00905 [SAR202 cluster bacterium]|nr:hypothetical protein [SAR202 cluster bacterium]